MATGKQGYTAPAFTLLHYSIFDNMKPKAPLFPAVPVPLFSYPLFVGALAGQGEVLALYRLHFFLNNAHNVAV